MIRRAIGACFGALSAAGGSGPLRAALASVYIVALSPFAQRLGLWALALIELSVGGLLAGLVIAASRRRGFSTRVWEPAERVVLLAFCLLTIAHGLFLENLPALAIGLVLGATRLHHAVSASNVRRQLAGHEGETIATVAVHEAIDRHVNDPDPFGAAWRDVSSEIARLRRCRDVVALSLAEDHEVAADRLLAARAEGAAVMPPRIFQK